MACWRLALSSHTHTQRSLKNVLGPAVSNKRVNPRARAGTSRSPFIPSACTRVKWRMALLGSQLTRSGKKFFFFFKGAWSRFPVYSLISGWCLTYARSAWVSLFGSAQLRQHGSNPNPGARSAAWPPFPIEPSDSTRVFTCKTYKSLFIYFTIAFIIVFIIRHILYLSSL